MTTAYRMAPVHGLHHLSNETRMIATPWSRMVRGIGLGQYPVAYDPEAAARIRHTFALLEAKGVDDAYTRFSRLLADFVHDSCRQSVFEGDINSLCRARNRPLQFRWSKRDNHLSMAAQQFG